MKKLVLKFLIVATVLFSMCSISFAANKVIKSVAVTDIDAPYSTEKVLDTKGEVPRNATYRITEVAWKLPGNSSSGFYEVSVTLKASIGYVFDETTTGTINSKDILSKELIDEDKLKITYAFKDEKSEIGSATTTLRHRIFTYCDSRMGTITPSTPRVLHDDTVTISIVPNDGYKIKDVEVDGDSVGAVSEYKFRRVREEHTIRAYFEEIKKDDNKQDTTTKERPILEFIKKILNMF